MLANKETAGDKPEEGGDDVKSSWPLRPGLHTCYIVVGVEVWGVSPDGAVTGADLGGSSKYSNENFED